MEYTGKVWSKEEEIQLEKLYVTYNVKIPELAGIHKRSPAEIKFRLIKLGLHPESNIILQEVQELEKDQRGGTELFINKIISKHLDDHLKRIIMLELKVKLLTDQLDRLKEAW